MRSIKNRFSLRLLTALMAVILCVSAAPVVYAEAFAVAGAQTAAGTLALAGGQATSATQAADAVPGKVTLTSISSGGYHEVTLKWKEVSGADKYIVYYRTGRTAQWTKIAIVNAPKHSYTHVSSSAFPIRVGTNYTYTVRAYNSKTKKASEFDRKGLTIKTVPDPVPLKSAVWNKAGDAVTVTWGSTPGGKYYRIYRKTDSAPTWKSIATIKNTATSYVDKNPVAGEKNYYTVRVYNNIVKVLGRCNTNGIAAVSYTAHAEENTVAKLLGKTQTAKKTSQIILVVDHNLSFWEKDKDGGWLRKLSVYCGYGQNGMSDDRHEGDRTTPIGSFPILHAFGIAANPGTTMQYKKVTSNSYWSGEYSTYNTWVESTRKVDGEHLIDYYQYKYAMAIGFNRNPTVYKKGSAIFLHVKSTDHWYTAGCVSVEESVMKKLLLMSRNGVYIIIVKNRADIAGY